MTVERTPGMERVLCISADNNPLRGSFLTDPGTQVRGRHTHQCSNGGVSCQHAATRPRFTHAPAAAFAAAAANCCCCCCCCRAPPSCLRPPTRARTATRRLRAPSRRPRPSTRSTTSGSASLQRSSTLAQVSGSSNSGSSSVAEAGIASVIRGVPPPTPLQAPCGRASTAIGHWRRARHLPPPTPLPPHREDLPAARRPSSRRQPPRARRRRHQTPLPRLLASAPTAAQAARRWRTASTAHWQSACAPPP